MPVFVVIALNQPSEIEKRLQETVKEELVFQIKEDTWLVDYEGISRQLAEKLDLRKRLDEIRKHTGIVLPITNYSGLASPDIWEWLGTRMARREG